MRATATLTVRRALVAAIAAIAVGGGYAALLAAHAPRRQPDRPTWTEMTWPFATDQWGRGRAFRCQAAACGSDIDLYLRAKLSFCNCASEIDDNEVDRVADFDLVGGDHAGLHPGLPIGMHGMDGRTRSYELGRHGGKGRSVLVVALHDRCDMVVATAVVTSAEPVTQASAVIEFLKSDEVRRWAEETLGL